MVHETGFPSELAALAELYAVERLVGAGGGGRVFLGVQRNLGRKVAIKVVDSRRRDDGERIVREGRILSLLRHPGIVDVIDAGSQDGLTYIVMTFVDGESLRSYLDSKGVFAPARAFAIALTLLQALQYLHESHIVHRDLKPENIVLTPDGQPKIIDFGVSIHGDWSRLTETGTAIGTPTYMAPEQVMGHDVEGTADLYSLGLILYEMVYGTNPMALASIPLIVSKHLNTAVHSLPVEPPLSPAARQFLMTLLTRDRGGRYAGAREAVAAASAICARADLSQVVGARHKSPRKTLPMSTERFRQIPPGRILLWFGLIGLCSILLMSRRSSGPPAQAASPITNDSQLLNICLLFVSPSHDGANVDFDCRGPRDIRLVVTSETNGSDVHSQTLRAQKGHCQSLIRGLAPDTKYLLDIVPVAGWGGLRHRRFRTWNLAHRDVVSTYIRELERTRWGDPVTQLDTVQSGLAAGLDAVGKHRDTARRARPATGDPRLLVIKDNLDPRLLPVLHAKLAAEMPPAYVDALRLAQIFQYFGDRVGAGLLLKRLGRAPGGWSRAEWESVVIRLCRAGAPGAAAFCREYLRPPAYGAEHQGDLLVALAREESFADLTARLLDLERASRFLDPPAAMEALYQIDPLRARGWLTQRLVQLPQAFTAAILMRGLVYRPEPPDVALMEPYLINHKQKVDKMVLAHIPLAGPVYGPLVERVLAVAPAEPAALYLAGVLDVRTKGGHLYTILTRAGEPLAARCAAAIGLGYLGDRAFAPALRPLLADPGPLGARAAWSLGRLGDRDAVPALLERAQAPGEARAPATWALGAIGDPRAWPVLRRLAKGLVDAPGPDDQDLLGLAIWGLGRAKDPVDRPLFERLTAPDFGLFVKRRAAEALGRRQLGPHGTSHLIFPFLPLYRTGVTPKLDQDVSYEALGEGELRNAAGGWLFPHHEVGDWETDWRKYMLRVLYAGHVVMTRDRARADRCFYTREEPAELLVFTQHPQTWADTDWVQPRWKGILEVVLRVGE